MSQEQVEAFRLGHPYAVISISSPYFVGERVPCLKKPLALKVDSNRVGHLMLEFHDLDKKPDQELNRPVILYDANMAEQVRRFVMEYLNRVDDLVIHCEAGISRSPGMAEAIQAALDISVVIWYQPNRIPNARVRQLTLRGFKLR